MSVPLGIITQHCAAPGLSRSCLALLLFAHLLLAGAVCPAATLTASLDRDTLNLGETASLSLTVDGGEPEADPTPGNIPNLQIAFVGPTRQFSFANGQTSSSVTYNFRVVPRQTGDYTIPAVSVRVGGQTLTSQPIQLKVLKPSAPPPDSVNSGNQLAFMRLLLPKKEFYSGETFVAQIQLFLHSRVRNIGNVQFAAPEGLNLGKIGQGQRRQTQIGGTIYTVIPLSAAFTAIKAGTFQTALTGTAVLEVAPANRRRDPFMDPFDFFGGGEQQQASLASETETIHLLPLPQEGKPPTYAGAVGSYNMSVTAGPTNVTAGDPITVKIQISGRGSLDNISLPDQSGWDQFQRFPMTSKVETTDQLGIQGAKTFEQVVSPKGAEVKALPPVGFSFFDPDQKQYRTLTHPPIPLIVRPAGAQVAPVVAASHRQAEDSPAGQDIVPNKQRLGTLAKVSPPLALQPWFLALQGLPLLAYLSALVRRRRADSYARNPRLRRQRQVAAAVAAGLGELRTAASQNRSDEFFATVFRLMQEQLGERLDMPASAITEAVIEERLQPRGLPDAVLQPVRELFDACNLARYAPMKSSQELTALIPKVEGTLRQLAAMKL